MLSRIIFLGTILTLPHLASFGLLDGLLGRNSGGNSNRGLLGDVLSGGPTGKELVGGLVGGLLGGESLHKKVFGNCKPDFRKEVKVMYSNCFGKGDHKQQISDFLNIIPSILNNMIERFTIGECSFYADQIYVIMDGITSILHHAKMLALQGNFDMIVVASKYMKFFCDDSFLTSLLSSITGVLNRELDILKHMNPPSIGGSFSLGEISDILISETYSFADLMRGHPLEPSFGSLLCFITNVFYYSSMCECFDYLNQVSTILTLFQLCHLLVTNVGSRTLLGGLLS